jgi:hypothetical protein
MSAIAQRTKSIGSVRNHDLIGRFPNSGQCVFDGPFGAALTTRAEPSTAFCPRAVLRDDGTEQLRGMGSCHSLPHH